MFSQFQAPGPFWSLIQPRPQALQRHLISLQPQCHLLTHHLLLPNPLQGLSLLILCSCLPIQSTASSMSPSVSHKHLQQAPSPSHFLHWLLGSAFSPPRFLWSFPQVWSPSSPSSSSLWPSQMSVVSAGTLSSSIFFPSHHPGLASSSMDLVSTWVSESTKEKGSVLSSLKPSIPVSPSSSDRNGPGPSLPC